MNHLGIMNKQKNILVISVLRSTQMSEYYKQDFYSECPEDDCKGEVEGVGWADKYGEIVKFIYQECGKCGWNQAS